MTPERWQEIRAVFEQAEMQIENERARYLDAACKGDAGLRNEVESLLAAAARAGGEFLGSPVAGLMQQLPEEEPHSARIGRRVGAYKIIAEIGHGGMGEVYRAVRIDGQFDQQVAIKLVRLGLGSDFVVQRFLHERQILASLNHPHIARLLDGGTTEDGVPYLVMELIEGERIDVYCADRKLPVNETLRLFLEVCAAVQYAHQRLVIHRDIKPSNILIAKDGVPKLLDFGIAKMLDPAAGDETTLIRPMTPEYASPEQIRGETMTTATDVYSLGVVLFQLLTGRSPYGSHVRTPHELSQAIAGTQPQRPSSVVMAAPRAKTKNEHSFEESKQANSARELSSARLRRRLAGDIDSILLMALRKEPELRYRSVEQFADDISRHLNGRPVIARKGSWNYSARKFVARHRTAMAATALVILSLSAGIVTTARQARIAQIERARAQKRFDDVRRFSDSLIFEIHDALQAIPGTTSARSLLLDRAVQYLDSVSKDAEGDFELQRELARAYQRLATVQGDSTVSNTGQISAAEMSTRKAMNLFEAVANKNPANVADQLNLAILHRQKGISDIYYPDGRPEIEKAIAITDRLIRTDGANRKVQLERAIELQGLGLCFDISGDRSASVALLQNSLTLVDAIAERDPTYQNIGARKAKLLVQLGTEFAYTGALDKARQSAAAGVKSYQEIVAKGAQPDTIRDLAASMVRLGKIELMASDVSSAGQRFKEAREIIEPLAKSDSGNVLFRSDLLSLEFEEGRLHVLQGNLKEGESQLKRVIADFAKLGSEEDSGPGNGVMHSWVGESEFGLKNYPQALQSFQKSIAALESDVQYDDSRTGLITGYVRLGDAQRKLGHLPEAEAAYNKARSKADFASAKIRSDIPAMYAAAEDNQAFAELWMQKSTSADQSEEGALRKKSCDIYHASLDMRRLIPVQLRFSPSEFPVIAQSQSTEYQRLCDSIPMAPTN